MIEVDWSKAPEGAEAGQPDRPELYAAWYRRDADGFIEQICEGAGVTRWADMGGRKDFPVGAVFRKIPDEVPSHD